MNELKSRRTNDILIAVVDGLKGFPEAITAVFPDTVVQTCIVHLIRYSMQFASWKERKLIAKAWKPIYQARDAEAAQLELQKVDERPWGQKYPAIAQSWRRNWEAVIPFFVFTGEGAQDHLHHQRHRQLERFGEEGRAQQGAFPSDQAATKLIWLALRNITANRKRPPIA